RRRHTRSKRDWSSDVCSSDLAERPGACGGWGRAVPGARPDATGQGAPGAGRGHGLRGSSTAPSRSIVVAMSSPQPPYEQVRREIIEQVRTGELTPGDKLPAIRTHAADLGRAAGTRARAYTLLEESRVIATPRAAGPPRERRRRPAGWRKPPSARPAVRSMRGSRPCSPVRSPPPGPAAHATWRSSPRCAPRSRGRAAADRRDRAPVTVPGGMIRLERLGPEHAEEILSGQDEQLAEEIVGQRWTRESLDAFLARAARWRADGPIREFAAVDGGEAAGPAGPGTLLGGGGLHLVDPGLERGQAVMTYWLLDRHRGR